MESVYYSEECNIILTIGNEGTNGEFFIQSSKKSPSGEHILSINPNQYNEIFDIITKYYTFIGYV